MTNLPAAEVVIGLRDASDSVGRVYLSIPGGAEIAAARAAISALLGPLLGLSTCTVVSYSVTYSTYISSAKPGPGSPSAARAVFVFDTSQADTYAVVAVPGINPALVAEDGTIDLEQPDVAALVAALVAGAWTNPFGAELTNLVASYYEFMP